MGLLEKAQYKKVPTEKKIVKEKEDQLKAKGLLEKANQKKIPTDIKVIKKIVKEKEDHPKAKGLFQKVKQKRDIITEKKTNDEDIKPKHDENKDVIEEKTRDWNLSPLYIKFYTKIIRILN